MHWHPRRDDAGQRVPIRRPSKASAPATWADPGALALFVPGGLVPAALGGVPLAPWHPPQEDTAWSALAASMPVAEPPFACPAALQPAAGALVVERDGRAWCVAPSNGYGGHALVLPKGRADGRSLAATALVEVFEEVGLRVRLLDFVCDVQRAVTCTRYFLAARIGGSPADMGWESQACVLAPMAALRGMLTHPGDQAVLDAYDAIRGPRRQG
ncbi:MAG TPA: NUDIX domain-containing protein [Burkholderiaceae bacterium]|nr:NUDIX domain-containing protein [Burkholderiaceae bacterium]